MSVNITVTVPLETLAAFSSGIGRQGATEAVTKSVIESLEAIPYNIMPKTVKDEAAASVKVQSVASFTEGAGKLTPTSTIVDDDPPKIICIGVKTLTGKTTMIRLPDDSRWSQVAAAVNEIEGIPVNQQRIIFNGKQRWSGRVGWAGEMPEPTLKESGVSDGCENVHLVLSMRG